MTDVISYLSAAGWQQLRQAGLLATVWSRSVARDGADHTYEVLVPASDDLGDSSLRLRELAHTVADAERRAVDDVVGDMASPMSDAPTFHVWPDEPDRPVLLTDGAAAVKGVRDALIAAGRAVDEGPSRSFRDRPSSAVARAIDPVALSLDTVRGLRLHARVPIGGAADTRGTEQSLPRRMLLQLDAAVETLAALVGDGASDLVDEAVDAGVSSDLCRALASVAGARPTTVFEVGFRWAHAVPSSRPARTVVFPAGSGPLLRALGRRLGAPPPGSISVVGIVDSLFDHPAGEDRWRARVRGSLTESSTGAPDPAFSAPVRGGRVWVRLPDAAGYDAAVRAHREGRPVRASGPVVTSGRRTEIVTGPIGLEFLDPPLPEPLTD